MKFEYYKNEPKELFDLINECFDLNVSYNGIDISDNQRFLLLRNNDELIGCSLITLKKDPIRNLKTFYLDYICIKKSYRGQGLGHKLFQEIERIARSENIDYLELTSNKSRISARKLYLEEQMKIKDTDLFIKYLR